MSTNLPTNIDSTYADQSPGDKTHQQHHDQIHGYTNTHSTASDPHGDRAAAAAAYEPKVTELFLPAGRFDLREGTPALGAVNVWTVWLFDAAGSEGVVVTFGRGEIPPNWLTYSVEILWANTAATAGNVVWQIGSAAPRGEGDTVTVDVNTTTAAVAAGTTAVVIRTPVSGTHNVPTATDPLGFLRVIRLGADAGDTLGNDAGLLGLRLLRAT